MPTEAELLAAFGYPYLPVRVRHRAPLAWHPLRDAEEVGRYAYTGADGAPHFECIRFHRVAHDDGAVEKAFLWRLAETGEWRWGLDGADLVPYRLPRVLAAAAAGERVFVVEGEKDVHALEAIGLTATCNPLGALQWTERHAEALRGADAIVIPDHDRAGMVHAARVAATLRGRARSAALILLPG
jgi:putative DNA primase/helicase